MYIEYKLKAFTFINHQLYELSTASGGVVGGKNLNTHMQENSIYWAPIMCQSQSEGLLTHGHI